MELSEGPAMPPSKGLMCLLGGLYILTLDIWPLRYGYH